MSIAEAQLLQTLKEQVKRLEARVAALEKDKARAEEKPKRAHA